MIYYSKLSFNYLEYWIFVRYLVILVCEKMVLLQVEVLVVKTTHRNSGVNYV